MRSVKLPTLKAGEIMAHEATNTVGQVVGTVYPPDNKLKGFQQVLLLPNGTRQMFPLVELRPATEAELRRFAG
jgi:hypothetical protein